MSGLADGRVIGARLLDDDVLQAGVDALFEAMPGTDTSVRSVEVRRSWRPWMAEAISAIWLRAVQEAPEPRPDERRMRDLMAQMVAVRVERDELERRLREVEVALRDLEAPQADEKLVERVRILDMGLRSAMATVERLKRDLAQEKREHAETVAALERSAA